MPHSKRSSLPALFAHLLAGAAALTSSLSAQIAPPPNPIYYVDASGPAGSGLSWNNTTNDLRQALINAGFSARIYLAPNIAQVWVKEGIYTPANIPSGGSATQQDRELSFPMLERVQVYGGFLGGEMFSNARLGSAANTILSGDLLGNSQAGVFNTLTDDSIHVVTVPESPNVVLFMNAAANAPANDNWILDGFTVTFGNADGSNATTPALIPNTVDGAGIYFRDYGGSTPPGTHFWTVTDVTVENCRAVGRGPGVYIHGAAGPTPPGGQPCVFSECAFRSNVADWGGSGFESNNTASVRRSGIRRGLWCRSVSAELHLLE